MTEAEKDNKLIPKSACYSLVQIIAATAVASLQTDAPLSIEEATDVLCLAYPMKDRQQEMLYDGCFKGLAEPFSRTRAPSTGVGLDHEMICTVQDLYDIKWWDQSQKRGDVTADRLRERMLTLVKKEDASSIWERIWRYLGVSPVPDITRTIGSSFNPLEGAEYALGADGTALERAHARIAELERERDELLKRIEASAKTPGEATINSPTLHRILGAVADYPAWREAQNQEPNLKAVLGWQEEQQDGKGNASRVAHVAHHIIAEHFGLKS